MKLIHARRCDAGSAFIIITRIFGIKVWKKKFAGLFTHSHSMTRRRGGLAGSSLPLWTPAVTSASQNEVGSNPRGPGALAATHALIYAKLYIQQYIKTQSSKPTITARRASIHSSISHSLINHSFIHSANIYLVLHINKEKCWPSLREKRRLSFWSAVFKVNSNRTKWSVSCVVDVLELRCDTEHHIQSYLKHHC